MLERPQAKQTSALNALMASLRRAGYHVRHDYAHRAPEQIVFCWSWGTSETVRMTNPGAVICTLDHGYTADRGHLVNTGWATPDMYMGLNGFGEHAWVEDGGLRAEALGLIKELEPPRPVSGLRRALLLGQVYGDAMVRTQVRDYPSWLRERKEALDQEGWHVTFRPHPVMVRRGLAHEYGNLGRMSVNENLRADLLQADRTIALSSNGLLNGYMMGVQPEVWNPGSMLSPLVKEYGSVVCFDQRREWVHKLAWAQWHISELEDGTWLKHHAPIMHRLVETGEARPWNKRTI